MGGAELIQDPLAERLPLARHFPYLMLIEHFFPRQVPKCLDDGVSSRTCWQGVSVVRRSHIAYVWFPLRDVGASQGAACRCGCHHECRSTATRCRRSLATYASSCWAGDASVTDLRSGFHNVERIVECVRHCITSSLTPADP